MDKKLKINWYRCPIDTATLRALTKRSNTKGFYYALGQILLFVVTGYFVRYFFVRHIWVGFAVVLWLHGTIRGVVSSNSFHPARLALNTHR